jgi:hypothetical protein
MNKARETRGLIFLTENISLFTVKENLVCEVERNEVMGFILPLVEEK